ncbi:MAG: hypothetical protein EOO91_06685 [Pedobacter sp.]|nr:MAG: hypothetical protein EOO91_06685 [Pedobacter sp.]
MKKYLALLTFLFAFQLSADAQNKSLKQFNFMLGTQNDNHTIKFILLPVKENTFTFGNSAHDFPQKIVYQSKGKDELLAWIEGEKDGTKRKSEFSYQRKK